MTASWKYVKRLIGLMLGLVGLISWLALQTPAMPLPSVSSYVITFDSFTFADKLDDQAAAHRTVPASGSKPSKLSSGLPPRLAANKIQTGYGAKIISGGSGYDFSLGLCR